MATDLRRFALTTTAFAAAYALAMVVGRATRLDGTDTALVWPAAAVAVIWFLQARTWRRILASCTVLALTTVTVNHLTSAPWGLSAGFALVNLGCALFTARSLSWRGHEPRLADPRDLTWLLGSVSVGAVGSAAYGAVLLAMRGTPWLEAFTSFATRNGVSAFVGVAVYLGVAEARRARQWVGSSTDSWLRRLEKVAILALGLGVYLSVFVVNTGNPFAYLLIPVSVFVGLRLSTSAGIVYTLVLGTALVASTLLGRGVFVNGDVALRAVLAQSLVGCCLLVTLTIALFRDSRARLVADLDAAHDRTRADAEQLRLLALYDPLTGLANRSLLTERLEHALATSHRTACTVGVLFLDLDGFKQVNDQWGHSAGDDVLVEVARRLSALARPGDTVSRLGGDEFVVVCPDLRDASELGAVARRHAEALDHPIDLGRGRVVPRASASIGTATSTAGSDVDSMLSSADHTMYVAKRHRAGGVTTGAASIPA